MKNGSATRPVDVDSGLSRFDGGSVDGEVWQNMTDLDGEVVWNERVLGIWFWRRLGFGNKHRHFF